SAGAWYFTPDGQPAIAGDATFKAALTNLTHLIRSDVYKPAFGWNEYLANFTSGDAAGAVTGVWMTGTIKAQPDQSGKWGVAPIPKLDGVEGATHASNLG